MKTSLLGSNGRRVRETNELLVLDLVRRRGPLSRPMIVDLTRLEFQTVSNICTRLIESGFLVESGTVTGSPRRSRALVVNPHSAYSVGVEITRTEASVAVIAFDGSMLARKQLGVIDEKPDDVIDAAARCARDMIAQLALVNEAIAGAGLSVPGPFNARLGKILAPPNFELWHDYPARSRLAQAIGLPVWMENNSSSAARGEQWTGLGRDSDDFVFVMIGTGVGMGIVSGGVSVQGGFGNAGELAHISSDPDGPLCSCGQRGCLLQYATPRAILHLIRRAALEESNRNPRLEFPVTWSAEDLGRDDLPPWVSNVIDSCLKEVGEAIARMAVLIDPEKIIFGGPATKLFGRRYVLEVEKALAQLPSLGRPRPSVHLSANADDAVLLGAASLPFHARFSPTARGIVERIQAGLEPDVGAGRA